MIMEITHDEHCDMLLTLCACNRFPALLSETTRYVLFVDVIQRLMCSDYRSSVKRNSYVTSECRLPRTVRTQVNENAGTAAVERQQSTNSRDVA
jgi:hypothetical protein